MIQEKVARELHKIIKEHGTEIEERLNALLDALVDGEHLNPAVRREFRKQCDTYRDKTYDEVSDNARKKMLTWADRLLDVIRNEVT